MASDLPAAAPQQGPSTVRLFDPVLVHDDPDGLVNRVYGDDNPQS